MPLAQSLFQPDADIPGFLFTHAVLHGVAVPFGFESHLLQIKSRLLAQSIGHYRIIQAVSLKNGQVAGREFSLIGLSHE